MNPVRTVTVSLLALFIAMSAGTSLAQQQGGRPDRPGMQRDAGGGRMSGEERQRLREELQRQQAAPQRADNDERARRYAEWQRLSPEQRERVRGDMREANRDLERRR